LAFYRDQGNEIIDLDPEVQYATHDAGRKWSEGKAKENAWFARVFESQKEFEKLWADAPRYRNVLERPQKT